MAEDVDRPGGDLLPAPPESVLPERVEEKAPSTELGFPSGRQPPSTYAPRFRMITGALIGIAIGALAATALLRTGGGPGDREGAAWSAWKPSKDSTTDGAEEIAKFVGGRYRMSSGDQLVLVTGGPLRVAKLDIPVRLATRETSGGASEVKGRTVMYQLCGLGPQCAINKGKPSTTRFLMLRREALELALYSFRYLGGVKNVVALLPPAPGRKPENAMLFRKGDFEAALDRPLAATLPSPPPSLNALPASPEKVLIERMTAENLFRYSFQQGQDLSAFLVLQERPSS